MSCGLYIHVPFCLHKCPYCDFYSIGYSAETAEKYVNAVINSFGAFPRTDIDTVYFGGGTPSLLSPGQIGRILSAASDRFTVSSGSEITMECNPATADTERFREYRAAGVNRLSIGVQSLHDTVLRESGRIHNADEAVRCVNDAYHAGFENISIDLMMGLPGDDTASFLSTLARACELPVKHISAYMLKLMPGTPFGDSPPASIADDDLAAEMYESCCSFLDDRGFAQYEISNFAVPGYESRHNLKYWMLDPYIGIGPAAHGFLDGSRYSFSPDLSAFLKAYGEGCPDIGSVTDFEGVTDVSEYIMLRLRTTCGISFDELYELYNFSFKNEHFRFMDTCVSGGLAERSGDTFRLTSKGFLLSNEIISRLI